MPEHNGKIYVGSAKYISGENTNGPWEICKIWLKDVNELAANMNAQNGINLNMVQLRQPTQGGFTHTLFIDTYKPQQQGGQQGQQQPQGRQQYQQQRQQPQQGYQQRQQPPPQGYQQGYQQEYQQPPQQRGPQQRQQPPQQGYQQPAPQQRGGPQDDGSFGAPPQPDPFEPVEGVDDDIPF